MKNKAKYLLLIFLVIIFIFITYLVKNDKIASFDDGIYKIVTINFSYPFTNFFKFITIFANYKVITLFCIILLLIIKNKLIGMSICINSLFSSGVNRLLKSIFVRPRPSVLKLIKQSGYSYPSGHAMASMSLYGFLIYFIYKSSLNVKLKVILIIILSLLILLVGISRIYLGVHYASDILSGFIVSLILIFIYDISSSKLK